MSERFWKWADENPFGAVIVGALVGVLAVLLFLALVL